MKLEESLCSSNGRFRLTFQDNGDLVLNDLEDNNCPIWHTGTVRWTVVKAMMPGDGSLTLYDDQDRTVWTSGTSGKGDRTSTLIVQNNGDVQITSQGKTVWTSDSNPSIRRPRAKSDRLEVGEKLYPNDSLNSPNGLFCLKFQEDGNFVLYRGGEALWATGVRGDANLVVIQSNGNLLFLRSDRYRAPIVWESRTAKSDWISDPVLIMQDNGNAIITCKTGEVIWNTYTMKQKKPNQLEIGNILMRGQSLVSPNGRYKLIVDGNVVLYDGTTALWDTKTQNYGNFVLELLSDSRLVLQDLDGRKPVWSTKTQNRGNERTVFTLDDDGNITLSADGQEFWRAITRQQPPRTIQDRLEGGQILRRGEFLISQNRKSKLIMQDDGNFVLYIDSDPAWSSDTQNAEFVMLQKSGNLVVYSRSSEEQWSAGAHGEGNPSLIMQDDGNAVIYSAGKAIWSSGT